MSQQLLRKWPLKLENESFSRSDLPCKTSDVWTSARAPHETLTKHSQIQTQATRIQICKTPGEKKTPLLLHFGAHKSKVWLGPRLWQLDRSDFKSHKSTSWKAPFWICFFAERRRKETQHQRLFSTAGWFWQEVRWIQRHVAMHHGVVTHEVWLPVSEELWLAHLECDRLKVCTSYLLNFLWRGPHFPNVAVYQIIPDWCVKHSNYEC